MAYPPFDPLPSPGSPWRYHPGVKGCDTDAGSAEICSTASVSNLVNNASYSVP